MGHWNNTTSVSDKAPPKQTKMVEERGPSQQGRGFGSRSDWTMTGNANTRSEELGGPEAEGSSHTYPRPSLEEGTQRPLLRLRVSGTKR